VIGIQVGVLGLEGHMRKLEQAERENFERRLDEAIFRGAQLVHDTAVTIVPVRYGRLKNSIRIEKKGPFRYAVKAGGTTVLGKYVDYAHFMEFGTRKVRPRPFLVPAAEARRKEVEKLVADAVSPLKIRRMR